MSRMFPAAFSTTTCTAPFASPASAQSGAEATVPPIGAQDENASVIDDVRLYQSCPPAAATMLTDHTPNPPLSVQTVGLNVNVPTGGAIVTGSAQWPPPEVMT